MKLYHGTNGEWVGNILRCGLEPRWGKPGRNNWTHVPSNARCVYLTNSYAPYFAFNAEKGSCAVIEVDVEKLDADKLYPDEDFLEQASRGHENGPKGTMSQRTLYYRKRQFEYDSSWLCEMNNGDSFTWWKASLKYLGTCAHRGAIPASAITRVVSWPHKPNIELMFVWDPTISLANQRFMGDQYKALTAKLFGDPIPEGLDIHEFNMKYIESFDQSKIEGLEVKSIKQPFMSEPKS